jgi:hypothetical protein
MVFENLFGISPAEVFGDLESVNLFPQKIEPSLIKLRSRSSSILTGVEDV